MVVNTHEAKTHFSKFVEMALRGDEVIIARGGKALVRLVPLENASAVRKSGLSRGKIQVAEDFDAPLPDELLAEFEK